jgi:GntR family transcriptional regulator/MocR family aminotransferase
MPRATLRALVVGAALGASVVAGLAGAVMDSPCRHNGLVDRSKPGLDDRSITVGADFLQLNVDDAPAGGRADWLAGRLRDAIADGRLPLGSRLPATRVLAAELQVSRGVVTEAYQRLTEDGHVAGRGRNGTIIVAVPVLTPSGGVGGVGGVGGAGADGGLVGAAGAGGGGGLVESAGLFAEAPGADVFDELRAAPARIDLTPGLPDLTAFPRAAWLRAERAVLSDLSPAAFGYSDPRGTPALREAVARWLARSRGIRADPADVIIVNGVAQALGLLAQVLRHEGFGEVAVEEPGSLGTRQHLQNWGLGTPPIPVDQGGILVDALAASGAPAVLLTPAHQFPTGVVLDGERRRDLMRWAADGGGLIIEDDYDAEHRYDRPPVPALRSMLAERVCYAASVSKLLAPALRVGWMLPPPQYAEALVAAKRSADLGNSVLPQLVLARLMETGELERQLRFLRGRHRRRRDTMIAAIGAHLPQATVHGAAAGVHLTITFEAGFAGGNAGATGLAGGNAGATGLADTDLAAAAIARGLKVQPLSWHCQRPYPPGLVLGYAANTPTDITDRITLLASLVRDLT